MGIRTSVDDAALEAEFLFWKAQFVLSLWIAVTFAVMTGVLIAFWPPGLGDAELRAFVREVWPPFVEFALWFGFLIGLLWAAARRIGCALAGTVPWEMTDDGRPFAARRFLGQAAVCLAFGASLLWMAQQFSLHVDGVHSSLLQLLAQSVRAGFSLASVCALLAIGPDLIKGRG